VRPTFPPLESISDRFSAALKSGVVTNGGPAVEEFEAALTAHLGVPTICFSSGMAALVAMLMVEGVEGYEVICPSFTFCATPHAIRMAGGKVVFADIDPITLTLDPVDVERKITPRTKAILGVDVYGVCCDYGALGRVADRCHVDVLYDSAPAFGSQFYGEPIGDFGRAQIFSFHATKPFSVGGEGGALCSTDRHFIEAAKKVRNFGIPGRIGFNGKMQEINALIGLEQMKSLYKLLPARTAAQTALHAALHRIPGVTAIVPPVHQVPIWTYYPILIDEEEFGMPRDHVYYKLRQRGIMTRLYYPAMHMDESYTAERTRLPVTERVASQVIALPVYNNHTEYEVDRVGVAMKEIRQCGS
jgi:dTDP-4-amino-4,6-dideoxyglucose